MAVIVAAAVSIAHADTVCLLDGARVEGVLKGVATGVVTVAVGAHARRFDVGAVGSVELSSTPAPSLMAQAGRCVAVAEDGSRLGLDGAGVADGKLTGRSAVGDVAIPLQAFAMILCPARNERPADIERMVSSLALKRGDQDVLVVAAAGGGDPVAVRGILIGIGGGQVVIEYDGVASPMPAETVKLIQTAEAARPRRPPTGAVTAVCVDGSTIVVESLRDDGGSVRVRSPSLGEVVVPRAALAGLRVDGGNVIPLTALTPQTRQTGFFDESFPWRKDRAVSGGPLVVNGRAYERGIGAHARCVLTYPLARGYRFFAALAGIDDSARMGAAVVSVEADGKPLAGPVRLEGGKAAQPLRVDVSGAERMTITVDFAEGTFGSGARVDLCDAVLVK